MSYVVNVWEQPPDLPLPADSAAIWQMLEGLRARRVSGPNPKHVELARQMNALFANTGDDDGDTDVWDGAPLNGHGDDLVWNIGIRSGERHGEAHSLLAMRAVALGLNVADEQADHLYLADGRILSDAPGAWCTPAFAAYFSGDHADAWQRFLVLGAQGNPVAQYNMASMVMRGEVGRKNGALAHALLLLGGQDAEAARLRRYLKPETQAAADALLPRLRQPGQFIALVERVLAPPPRRPAGAELSLVAVAPPAPPAAAPAPPAAARKPAALPDRPPASLPSSRQAGAASSDSTAARRAARHAARERERSERDRARPSGGRAPFVALGAGTLSVPLALWFAPSLGTGGTRALFALLALVGAWGVWRSAREIGLRTKATLALALLALVPLLGLLVCGGMLLRLMRHRAD